jgi:hypothetical protein
MASGYWATNRWRSALDKWPKFGGGEDRLAFLRAVDDPL